MAKAKVGDGPGMKHPLAGANLGTLLPALFGNGALAGGQHLRAAGILGAALGRLPFSLAERVWSMIAVEHHLDPPPVFIVGHWRSGTTHLYNIMSRGNFAYVPPLATGLPWDLLLIGGLFRRSLERALPSSRAIDNVPVNPDSPQEDEIALASMSELSFYHALYFPKRFHHHLERGLFFDGVSSDEVDEWQGRLKHFYAKLVHAQGGRQLLIKNPVYTGRVRMLAELFPGAKFINMVRNPYEVFVSMRNFYTKLLPELALQDYRHVDIDQVVLDVFPRLMERLEADVPALLPGRYVELRYEDLEAQPVEQIRRVYETLDLPGFEAARPAFEAYLASITSYEKNRFGFPPDVIELVDRHWSDHVARQGYAPPSSAAAAR
ncbi:MAG: sulfotransferase [Pseudomonadota bacterium]|nr:sulfotransferase [Pseudomonadota bacterium]